MRPLDGLLVASFVVVAMVLVTWLMFALATLFEGFPRLRINQILGIVGVSAFVMAIIVALGPGGGLVVLVFSPMAIVLLMFAGMWSREFRLLMLRRADEFPDRSDKLAWTFVLTVMAPAGVWLFRSYRKARWPEAEAAVPPHPLDTPEPLAHASAMDRVGA